MPSINGLNTNAISQLLETITRSDEAFWQNISDRRMQDAARRLEAVKPPRKDEGCKKGCCGDKGPASAQKNAGFNKDVFLEVPIEGPDALRPLDDPEELEKWGRYAWYLAWFTIVYNVVEGVLAIAYGWEEESIALMGFGVDSFVEVFSAAIVIWRLQREANMKKNTETQIVKLKVLFTEKVSAIAISVLLLLLSVSAVAGAIYRLITKGHPESSIPGIIISAASLSFMYFLYYWKMEAAKKLNSVTLEKDAMCSLGCIHLSCTLLFGSLLYLFTTKVYPKTEKTWWVDSAITFIIAFLIFKEGFEALRFACSKDFDGTCSCCSGPSQLNLNNSAPPAAAKQEKGERKQQEIELIM